MKACKECGEPMLLIDPATSICSELLVLSMRRFKANDRRPVSHALLADDPLVVEGPPGDATLMLSVSMDAQRFAELEAAATRPVSLGYAGDAAGDLEVRHVALTERGYELGGVTKKKEP